MIPEGKRLRWEYVVTLRGEYHYFSRLAEVRVFVEKNGAERIERNIYVRDLDFWNGERRTSSKELYLI